MKHQTPIKCPVCNKYLCIYIHCHNCMHYIRGGLRPNNTTNTCKLDTDGNYIKNFCKCHLQRDTTIELLGALCTKIQMQNNRIYELERDYNIIRNAFTQTYLLLRDVCNDKLKLYLKQDNILFNGFLSIKEKFIKYIY